VPALSSERSVVSEAAAVSSMILEIARLQMQEQLASSDSIDTKAVGVLGFTGIALGALVAASSVLGKYWWIPTIGLGASALFSAVAVRNREFDQGPELEAFYSTWGGSSLAEANAAMLSELLRAGGRNRTVLVWKGRFFLWGVMALLLTIIGSGVLFALVR
jgi:hypothetical protein